MNKTLETQIKADLIEVLRDFETYDVMWVSFKERMEALLGKWEQQWFEV